MLNELTHVAFWSRRPADRSVYLILISSGLDTSALATIRLHSASDVSLRRPHPPYVLSPTLTLHFQLGARKKPPPKKKHTKVAILINPAASQLLTSRRAAPPDALITAKSSTGDEKSAAGKSGGSDGVTVREFRKKQ